ncbi:MAG: efflux RND transporter periplasmic adaptor subunit [bacterium]|nr:efflux RND transporter periplasmic adaptor subunit [bacterium]
MNKDKLNIRLGMIVFLFELFICSIFISGCSKQHETKKNVRNVYVSLPKVEKINKTIKSFGKLTASKTVKIKPQVNGIIESIHFKEGSHVKKGDLLINIDPSEYKTQLEIDKAKLAKDKMDYEIKKYLADQTKILAEKSAIAKNEYAVTVAEMKDADAQIKIDEAIVKMCEIDLGYCKILSPTDGVISRIKVDVGNLVNPKTDEVLTTIKKINPLYVDFTIPDTYYTKLRNAMEDNELNVDIRLRQKSKISTEEVNKYTAKLDFLDNTVNPDTGTILLRGRIENGNFELWPGQMVRISLILGEIDKAVLIPTKAVRMGKKGEYVYIATSENKAKLVYVKTGQTIDDQTVILGEDIKPTDKIICVGLEGLGSGSSIKIIKDLSKEPEKE